MVGGERQSDTKSTCRKKKGRKRSGVLQWKEGEGEVASRSVWNYGRALSLSLEGGRKKETNEANYLRLKRKGGKVGRKLLSRRNWRRGKKKRERDLSKSTSSIVKNEGGVEKKIRAFSKGGRREGGFRKKTIMARGGGKREKRNSRRVCDPQGKKENYRKKLRKNR